MKSFKGLPFKLSQKARRRLNRLDGLFIKNPVLIEGLSLGPVIAISTSLQAGISLSIASLTIMLPTIFIAAFFSEKIPRSLRVIIYALISAVFFIPALFLSQKLFPDVIAKVGIFLPLMVVNPIIVFKAESTALKQPPLITLTESLSSVFGFSIVMCLISALRELFGNGTLLGITVSKNIAIPALLLPFSGFILLGFLSAGVRFFVRKLGKFVIIEKERE